MFSFPFLEKFSRLLKSHSLDDPIDRLHYLVTTFLLLTLSLMISAKQYFGRPIQCWMPAEFKSHWVDYVEDYCFIQNTYYRKLDNSVNSEFTDFQKQKATISYYQWVPITLALQAALFYLPNWIFNCSLNVTGVDIHQTVVDAKCLCHKGKDDRSDHVSRIASYFADSLQFIERKSNGRRRMGIRTSGLGSSVTLFYISTKILYLLNVVVQFGVLNEFVGSGTWNWGFTTLLNLLTDKNWMETGVFPRVTFCDFTIRNLANVQSNTVQCVLMVNMFNEKIYILLWFWFVLLLVLTSLNICHSIYHFLSSNSRENRIERWLDRSVYSTFVNYDEHVQKFNRDFLRSDGVLVLRFIEQHAGGIVTRDIVQSLFRKYLLISRATLYDFHENGRGYLNVGSEKSAYDSPSGMAV